MDLHTLAQSIVGLTDRGTVQRLSQLLSDWRQHAVLHILIALAGGFVLGRYRAYRVVKFQNIGETHLSRATLQNFGPPFIT